MTCSPDGVPLLLLKILGFVIDDKSGAFSPNDKFALALAEFDLWQNGEHFSSAPDVEAIQAVPLDLLARALDLWKANEKDQKSESFRVLGRVLKSIVDAGVLFEYADTPINSEEETGR